MEMTGKSPRILKFLYLVTMDSSKEDIEETCI